MLTSQTALPSIAACVADGIRIYYAHISKPIFIALFQHILWFQRRAGSKIAIFAAVDVVLISRQIDGRLPRGAERASEVIRSP